MKNTKIVAGIHVHCTITHEMLENFESAKNECRVLRDKITNFSMWLTYSAMFHLWVDNETIEDLNVYHCYMDTADSLINTVSEEEFEAKHFGVLHLLRKFYGAENVELRKGVLIVDTSCEDTKDRGFTWLDSERS